MNDAEHEYMNVSPPPFIELVTPLSGVVVIKYQDKNYCVQNIFECKQLM